MGRGEQASRRVEGEERRTFAGLAFLLAAGLGGEAGGLAGGFLGLAPKKEVIDTGRFSEPDMRSSARTGQGW